VKKAEENNPQVQAVVQFQGCLCGYRYRYDVLTIEGSQRNEFLHGKDKQIFVFASKLWTKYTVFRDETIWKVICPEKANKKQRHEHPSIFSSFERCN